MNPVFKRSLFLTFVVLAFAGALASLQSQETPYGRVKGTILAAETGRALPNVEVALARNDQTWYKTETDERGRFAFDRVEVGEYAITAETRAHEQPKGKLKVTEDATLDLPVELKPMAPFVQVLQNQKVFTTKEEVKYHVLGFIPAEALNLKVYRVKPEVAVERWDSWLTEGLDTGGQDLKIANLDAIPDLTPVETKQIPVAGRDIEGVFRQEIRLGARSPGMYLASLDAREGKASARGLFLMTVTDLGMVVKASQGGALVYAVNLQSGAPVPDASVRFLREKTQLGEGRTDSGGLLSFTIPPKSGEEEESRLQVVGMSGESMAVASLYVGGDDDRPLKVYTYTDRPVYRPGHTVHFKSMARELVEDEYRVPAAATAKIRVIDDKSNPVYTGTAGTNEYGSLNGAFDLNSNAIPGSYTLVVNLNGHDYETTFRVAEYRKPEYVVKVTPEKKRYVQGETVKATLSADYYFGAPVANANVEYYVTRSPSWYYPDSSEWDEDLGTEESGGGGGGESIHEGKGTTDATGKLQITVPPPADPPADTFGAEEGQDWEYSIEATVTDASNRTETDSASVLVTQGDFRLEASAEDGVAKPNQPVKTLIKAIDYDEKPVSGVKGEAVLYKVDWLHGVEKRAEIGREEWLADGNGDAAAILTPTRDGDYRIVVRSTDSRGRAVATTTWLWVLSEDSASFEYPYQDLDVKADKRLYKEGDTAEVIVNTKHSPVTALLTLEGAKVLQHRSVPLTGKTNVLQIPITPDLMPAAKLSIAFVKGKSLYSGEAVLNVSRERKALKVEVTPDKPTYLPNETATYHVRTLSPEGKPVAAEVSLGVVDEAIYAIQPETTTPIVPFFYPKRLYDVQTVFSSPNVYLSGDDKAGDTIQTRRDFKDTAFWSPATVTDADGTAMLRVKMPENLTTWRATVRAATLETDVGQGTSTAITQKPFLLRLEAPRFFTQGDEVGVAAIAHNLTKETLTAAVGLEVGGAKSGEEQAVKLEPGASQRVEWRITADEVGDVPVRVWARAGRYSDAMEQTLPVIAKGRETTVLRSGSVDTKETVTLPVTAGVVPGTGSLTLRLTPSLASAMLGSLDYLAQYPYGCTEQTMSAFLPDLMILELLDKVGLENPDLRRKLPGMVSAGLLKLYRYQHEDGGWRWWAYDETDPWMTAYVVFGLQQAKALGFEVNPNALQNGITALKKLGAEGKKIDADTRAYMTYVLALVGEAEAANATLAHLVSGGGTVEPSRLQGISDWGRGMLALALNGLGRGQEGRALLETVWPRFTVGNFSPDTTKRKDREWRSDTEYAAVLLIAAATLTPTDPRLPELVRGLLERRKGDHWHSTRDTAFALYGLTRYLAASQELAPDMTATVRVNGREVANRSFTAADLFRPEMEVTLDADELKAGPLSIEVEKTGAGRLYYSATWTGTAGGDLTQPLRNDSGLTVERRYRVMKPGEQPAFGNDKAPPPAGPGQTEFRPAQVVEVSLTLRTTRALDYVMLEDPLPAGMEASDRGAVEPWEWNYWWAEQVIRDEKVSFAVRHLEPGAKTITYRVFAQIPGMYTALPPRVFDMYNPDMRGEGGATTVTVQ